MAVERKVSEIEGSGNVETQTLHVRNGAGGVDAGDVCIVPPGPTNAVNLHDRHPDLVDAECADRQGRTTRWLRQSP